MIDLEHIKGIISEGEYTVYGLRAHRSETAPVVGQTLGRSYVWADGEITDEELRGICTVRVTDADDLEAVVDMLARIYCWDDEHLVLVGGHSGEWGNDDGEYIIHDNLCLDVIGRHHDKALLPA